LAVMSICHDHSVRSQGTCSEADMGSYSLISDDPMPHS
jgi:hypothetical protein